MTTRVLVVGAGGFIGTHFARALRTRGVEVLALVRRASTLLQHDVEQIVVEKAGPADFDGWLDRCDAVAWFASRSTPASTAGNPVAEVTENIAPFVAMLEALQSAPHCTLLFISSGGTLYGDAAQTIVSETHMLHPKSYHAAGKVATESFVSAFCHQFDRGATIIRPSNVYGPGQLPRNGFGIIPTAFQKMLGGTTLTVWGAETVRDYLYIDDFISLCMAVLASGKTTELNVFNASSGQGIRLDELLDLVEHTGKLPLKREYQPSRPVDVSRIVLDNSRARQFGWHPATRLEDGIAHAWNWFKHTRR